MKYMACFLVLFLCAGCFEGPTGPQGPKGDGIIESWSHVITSSETEYDADLQKYVVSLVDRRFEENCGYEFWYIYSEGNNVRMDGVVVVGEGLCVFNYHLNLTGKTLIIYKIKPS